MLVMFNLPLFTVQAKYEMWVSLFSFQSFNTEYRKYEFHFIQFVFSEESEPLIILDSFVLFSPFSPVTLPVIKQPAECCVLPFRHEVLDVTNISKLNDSKVEILWMQ